MSGDKIELTGTVVASNKGKFEVKINDTLIVLCTLSGKIKMNGVRILVSDNVRIEVSPYDTTKGRIVYRNKIGQ